MQEICRCGQELHGNARYERFFGAQAGLAGLLRRLEDRRLPHARVGRGQRRDAGSRHLLPLLRLILLGVGLLISLIVLGLIVHRIKTWTD